MKILMIANFVSFPFEGGNSRFTYILNMLDHKKNQLELVTSNFRHSTKSKREYSPEELSKVSYKITLLDEPGYKKNVSIKRFYSHKILSINLKKYLKKIDKPDLIYCAVPSLDLAKEAAKYAKNNNIRFIIDVQDLWPEAFKMVFKIPIIKDIVFLPLTLKANYIYKNADDIIAVSETYANRASQVNKKYNNKLSVFLGTDLEKFDKISTISRKNKEDIIVVYIGTLGHSYNLLDTIRAIKILNDKGINNILFKIMGDGPLKEMFELEAEKLNVKCDFSGRLPYEKMVQELRNCDIAINPIVSKSSGSIINKVGDYASAGLPVINTQECLEYRTLVKDYELGINCINDPKDIADKIEILINDTKLRKKMGKNNRKLAEEKFDRSVTYKQIIDVIEGKNNDK